MKTKKIPPPPQKKYVLYHKPSSGYAVTLGFFDVAQLSVRSDRDIRKALQIPEKTAKALMIILREQDRKDQYSLKEAPAIFPGTTFKVKFKESVGFGVVTDKNTLNMVTATSSGPMRIPLNDPDLTILIQV